MNTILLITLLIVVIAPAVIAVIGLHDRFDDLPSIPFGFDRDPAGPDADRIRAELAMLNLYRRDCA